MPSWIWDVLQRIALVGLLGLVSKITLSRGRRRRTEFARRAPIVFRESLPGHDWVDEPDPRAIVGRLRFKSVRRRRLRKLAVTASSTTLDGYTVTFFMSGGSSFAVLNSDARTPWIRVADRSKDFVRSNSPFGYGGKSVRIDRAAFDKAFTVRTSDRGFARALLTEELRNRLVTQPDWYVVEVRDGDVLVVFDSAEVARDDVASLALAITRELSAAAVQPV